MVICYFYTFAPCYILMGVMSCLNPVYITLYPQTEKERMVPVRCRECEDCKQASRSAAFVRMKYEYENCVRNKGMVFFFTLTFADEYVPFKFHRMCFDKKLVQNWLQSFRQTFRRKYGYRCKYFIVSELGHVGTHRPHHHGLLYLYPDDKYQLKSWRAGGKHHAEIPWFPASYASVIKHLWNYGRADVQVFDPARGGLMYVAKYISKDVEEDNLFKDILTRIKIKRGKGSNDLVKRMLYYAKTFPSLFAFMNRYCAFTLISNGVGASAPITHEMLVSDSKISVDGFDYSIPRYYVDRYVRKELLSEVPVFTHREGLKDIDIYNRSLQFSKEMRWVALPDVNSESGLNYYKKLCLVPPRDVGTFQAPPPDKVLNSYVIFDDKGNIVYKDVPMYKYRYTYTGERKVVKAVPLQSECSMLAEERKKWRFFHLLDSIEDMYFNLPPILKDSCAYDIPKLLMDASPLSCTDETCISEFGIQVLEHLNELNLVASEWRAKSRIAKREQDRKIKMQQNAPHARVPLSWSEYRVKSKYFNMFNK